MAEGPASKVGIHHEELGNSDQRSGRGAPYRRETRKWGRHDSAQKDAAEMPVSAELRAAYSAARLIAR